MNVHIMVFAHDHRIERFSIYSYALCVSIEHTPVPHRPLGVSILSTRHTQDNFNDTSNWKEYIYFEWVMTLHTNMMGKIVVCCKFIGIYDARAPFVDVHCACFEL